MLDTIKMVIKPIRNSLASILNQVLIIALAFIVVSIILAISGYDMASVFLGFGRSVGNDIGGTVRWATPLILCGLASAIAFKGGIWNIGIDGQIYVGAFAATAIGLTIANSLPKPLSIIVACAAAMIAGGLWAAIAGFLRVRWGANEIITTIMLNSIAIYLTNFMILGPFHQGAEAINEYSTSKLPEPFWLQRIIPGSSASTGFYVALVLAVLIYLIFKCTTFGYELKVMGTNLFFGHSGGIKIPSLFMKTIILSGAIGGLAGAIEILGIQHLFASNFSDGVGFDGIVVSILAQNNPLGVIISGFFFGALRNGAMVMQRVTEVPRAMIQLVEGVIIFSISAKFGLKFLKQRRNISKPPNEMKSVKPSKATEDSRTIS